MTSKLDFAYKETITANEVVFAGEVITVSNAEVVLPSKRKSTREMVSHQGGASIVALNAQNQIALVRQYRICFDECLQEIPAGKRDRAETYLACAQRELQEETGVIAKDWLELGKLKPSPGYTNEIIAVYLARNLEQGIPSPDEDENLELKWLDLDKAVEQCLNGTITDAKTLFGILATKQLLNIN